MLAGWGLSIQQEWGKGERAMQAHVTCAWLVGSLAHWLAAGAGPTTMGGSATALQYEILLFS